MCPPSSLIHSRTQRDHVRTNAWAAVALRLDLKAAMAEGFEFGLSTNGVSSGTQGTSFYMSADETIKMGAVEGHLLIGVMDGTFI